MVIKMLRYFFCLFQIRQAWYVLAGSLSKTLPLLLQTQIIATKQVEKLVSYVVGKLDESDSTISPVLWDAALFQFHTYQVRTWDMPVSRRLWSFKLRNTYNRLLNIRRFKGKYLTRAIITPGLYIFYPNFHCSLYCRTVSITTNLCTKQRNSSIFGPKIRGL